MIKNFKCKETAKLFDRYISHKLPKSIQRTALRKLLMIDAATCIKDLRIPPSNNLKQLTGKRQGQYSIRINKQYRICFVWLNGNAYKTKITDYH